MGWVDLIGVIIICTGLGAFVDFWIGKKGQQRLRKWSEDWWLRFAEVKLDNFGRREAEFCHQVLVRLFGKFWSRQRFDICYSIFMVGLLAVFLGIWSDLSDVWNLGGIVGALVLISIEYSVSITITMQIAKLSSLYLPEKKIYTLISVIITLVTQYYLIIFLGILALIITFLMANIFLFIGHQPSAAYAKMELFQEFFDRSTYSPYTIVEYFLYVEPKLEILYLIQTLTLMLGVVSHLGRFLVLLIFAFSFLLRPAQSIFLKITARIIESEKPIFTMVFGAIGAFVKGGSEIYKLVS